MTTKENKEKVTKKEETKVKDTKAPEVTTDEKMKDNKEILDELNKIDALLNPDTPAPTKSKSTKSTTKSTSKAKDTKAKDTKPANQAQPKPQVQVDTKLIEAILNELPEIVKTKDLNVVFDFNDGGKYMRRHLRSKFSEGHEHGEPWVWKKEDKQLMEIIEYFTLTLTPERKEQLVCIGGDIINTPSATPSPSTPQEAK